MERFNDYTEWYKFCRDVREEVLPDMLVSCVRIVKITTWFDAGHVGKHLITRFHTFAFIFVNYSPIVKYSKKCHDLILYVWLRNGRQE